MTKIAESGAAYCDVTRWYPASTRPPSDRPGWYEVDWGFVLPHGPVVTREWWDGELWRKGPGARVYLVQGRIWRGLTSPAKDTRDDVA